MGLLLGFAPLIVFSVLTGLSVDLALWLAFAAAFVIAIRDFAQTRILRMLDVGSMLLFGSLALYAGFIQPSLSVEAIRLLVDTGFLIGSCRSLLAGSPFTLDYLRDETAKELWETRDFIRSNVVMSGAWLCAFGIMSLVDIAAIFSRKIPLAVDRATGLVVLAVAIIFTARYPLQERLQPARAQRQRIAKRL
ncbi:MAG TPA: hypothetical protein VN154_02540 [Rhizomicrobium sp.]|nr:hypothetical protein [Rhizomicrobium sp.]